ncbi:MAG: Asp-tRNA(Asn)/Glu-tRNA(Gln) amidotransferase subunit GatB [Actinobacteria bacterium]|nr:Asp-tRNA(Asn)/Glu-tRNA(Gln) amidotransferase subunit GatB [Actinomycetota bacterium]
MTEYETVIGLECHVELSTRTKMFCACANTFGAPPNTLVCEVCLGHPGTLPVTNRQAIEHTMTIGLALGCDIAERSLFHRKNYFYPDMPKNYQISQYDLPLCVAGTLEIEVDGDTRAIGVHRVHLEEDTGKSTHASATGRIADAEYSLEDFNRAGVPLVEIVSEPDMRSPEEARAYLQELRLVLESLGVSDVRMEEGSLRCDANVSVREKGSKELGTKVEIKNLNSVRSLERAIRFEVDRQVKLIEAGKPEEVVQETRGWDENQGITRTQRSKEYAFDYRYFPEPDLQPIEPAKDWVDKLKAALPELPAAKRARFTKDFKLEPAVVGILTANREWAAFFETAVTEGAEARAAANWMTGDLAALLNESRTQLGSSKVTPRHVTDLTKLVADGTIGTPGAKAALAEAFASGEDIRAIVEAKGLKQISDAGELQTIVEQVIAENPGLVEQFRGGKDTVIGALMGQVMKASKGSANPQEAQRLLRESLSG